MVAVMVKRLSDGHIRSTGIDMLEQIVCFSKLDLRRGNLRRLSPLKERQTVCRIGWYNSTAKLYRAHRVGQSYGSKAPHASERNRVIRHQHNGSR